MAELEERYADADQRELDGISIDYDDWHFNVRPSNTEPLLRLTLESLVSQRGHGGQARRGAGPHPLVTDAAAAGYHCLPIPTPFAVGRVNCYLIEDDPLTLVDTGPNSGKALDELERALAEHGRRVEDLERIVITHQHIDHLGLVDILARRSGAEVCALDLLAPVIERLRRGGRARRRARRGADAAPRHPARRRLGAALGLARRSAPGAARARSRTRSPTARSSSFADRTLEVLHRPGHSPSDTVFHDRERRDR